MRNILKTATLESKFPVLSVERGCILSKDADVTVGFKVRLPELFTLTSAEYAAMHGAWVKAIKVLPCYTVVHRQDWFLEEKYRAVTGRNDMGFLDRSFELHFNERPFLNHYAYLFITRTTRERSLQQSNFSILYRGAIIPREVRDREAVVRFMESVDQFERIMGDSGLVGLERLTTDEIVGTGKRAGIIEKYFSLSQENTTTLKDISLSPAEMRIGDEILSVHTLSDADDLPAAVRTDGRFEKYSTDRSDCRLSFAAPVGLMLSHNHIYNQYVFMDDPADTLQRLEKTARNMQSLSRYSRANQINRQWIEEYLNEAHSFGLIPVRCHCNVMSWADSRERLRNVKNDTDSALALMGCKSFFTNHLVRNYYEQGAHILLVDTGNSYKGLCRLIHERTRGEDGIYIMYEEDRPITFNPFYSEDRQFDVEKRESIKTLILTLWKREDELPKRSEEVALSGAVNAYIRRITENPELKPDFNGFYEFVRDDYRRMMEKKRVREKDFDIDGFLNVLEPFYKGGDYDFHQVNCD